MKRLILTGLLGFGICSSVLAKPQQIFQNFGFTNTPVVDAIIFWNQGIFDASTDFTVTNANPNVNSGLSSLPYRTFDTLYFTNTSSGVMEGIPGFQFATVTSTSVHSASSFVNHGNVSAFDVAADPVIYSTSAGTIPDFVDSAPLASHVEVIATNVINDGTLAVGNYGVLMLTGSNVNTQNGVLVAGAVDTGGSDAGFFDSLDTTGDATGGLFYNGFEYYTAPPGVYDLFWGVTNGGTFRVDQFSPPQTTPVNVSARDGISVNSLSLPINFAANFATYVYSNNIDASNTDFNIVFVNTNFTDVNGQVNTNISASVGFSYDYTVLANQALDLRASMAVIQFAMPVTDVVTGTTVTNAVYLLDVGGTYSVMQEFVNAAYANSYSRPDAFAITTTTPDAWLASQSSNTVYDPTLLYSPATFVTTSPAYEASIYGAQIGRNPGQVDGNFTFQSTVDFFGSNFSFAVVGLAGQIALPDPTNEPGRIEINAKQANISNARLRAEGMVTLNATNFVGGAAGSDWGEINTSLGVTNGTLVISNVFPTNFQRLRGDVYAYSLNWENTVTNGFTNIYHYHVLVVDQNLGGNFQSAIRNLSLVGSNSITVQDPLYVINQSYFGTTNLTFNSNTVFTQNAGNLTPGNFPKLKNLLVNTNASITVDSVIDIGLDLTKNPPPPTNRKYSVLSVTNLGTISALTPLFQAQTFENDGAIVASNNGSMIIAAGAIGCGLAGTSPTNYLEADENITLSALEMQFLNSVIYAGGVLSTNRGQLLLQSGAGGDISDFQASDPSTNSYATNYWQVTDGFSLPVKPATGDLFGTEITTIASGYTVALHTWAGVDFGATSDGFSDNMVIGHLKLSRQSETASLQFTGAGSQNAMYVDYLELDTNSLSYSDYRNGLIIDSNLTIYFAGCNVDPLKLESVYTNRLVWVPSFSGPNSTVAVPLLGSENVCLMNANLADSSTIGFFGTTPNADNQPYVLNDPSNPTNTYPCPSDSTEFRDYLVPTGSTNVVRVELSVSGKGTITPVIKPTRMTLGKSYTLTATPAAGWVFTQWSANGLASGVDLTSRTITFQLQNNLLLTADFAPRAFTLVKGSYYGLFEPTNDVSLTNSGWFSLNVGANGAFSGKLLLADIAYGFNGVFATNGSATVTAKHGNNSVAVVLQLDMSGASGEVTGYVGSSANLLAGNVGAGWTSGNVSPYVGRYTMVLTNAASNAPAGYGYGAVSVSKSGVLSVAGKLADGPAFSQTTPISKDGLWPFYAYVGKSGDLLVGWIAFQAQSGHSANLLDTNIVWNKAASSQVGPYEAGFSNSVQMLGSPYADPGHFSSGLSLETPVVILSGAGLTPVTNAVTDTGHSIFETNNLSLTINPVVGTFNGLIKHSGSPSTRMSGVVLQNQNGAYGFYLGAENQSDAVLLQSK